MKKFLILFLILIFSTFVIACNVGERTSDQYCGTDAQLHDFLPNEATCDNDFECLSGNCIEGTCSETSAKEEYEKQKDLLSRILALLSGQEEPGEPGQPSQPGTSGGGSRSSGSGDDYSITKTFSKILPNRLYCFNINEIPIPVTKICFISNTESEDVKFDVERQETRASSIPKPEGLIYQYFTIDVENLPNQYIEKADITFKTTKDWIDQNNLKTYKLTLQKLLSAWNTLKPQIIAEDNVYYYYNSLTDGFSWFSITSLPPKPKYIPPVTEPMCGDGIIDLEENCENCPEDVICEDDEYCYEGRCVLEKKTSIIRYIIPLLLLLLIVVLILVLRRRKTLVVIKEKKPIKKLPPKSTNKFKNIRLKEGLKKAAIARAARLSSSTITNIEKNIDVKELSKRAALQALNTLIQRKTKIKNKYSYEQLFGIQPLISRIKLFSSKAEATNLRNYIKKAIKAKMPKKRIKALLMSKGWKSDQVEYIFKQLKK